MSETPAVYNTCSYISVEFPAVSHGVATLVIPRPTPIRYATARPALYPLSIEIGDTIRTKPVSDNPVTWVCYHL